MELRESMQKALDRLPEVRAREVTEGRVHVAEKSMIYEKTPGIAKLCFVFGKSGTQILYTHEVLRSGPALNDLKLARTGELKKYDVTPNTGYALQ